MLATSMRGKRIAWSPDLGDGRVSREVTALIKAAALRIAGLAHHRQFGAVELQYLTPDNLPEP